MGFLDHVPQRFVGKGQTFRVRLQSLTNERASQSPPVIANVLEAVHNLFSEVTFLRGTLNVETDSIEFTVRQDVELLIREQYEADITPGMQRLFGDDIFIFEYPDIPTVRERILGDIEEVAKDTAGFVGGIAGAVLSPIKTPLVVVGSVLLLGGVIWLAIQAKALKGVVS
ncbi:MAG: hypothetical protein ACYS1A_16865 [Planctomycetota bacterium]|jgi:hypothetical protein